MQPTQGPIQPPGSLPQTAFPGPPGLLETDVEYFLSEKMFKSY